MESHAQSTCRRRDLNARQGKSAAEQALLIRYDTLCSNLSGLIQKAITAALALAPPSDEPKKGSAAHIAAHAMDYLMEELTSPEGRKRQERMYDAAAVAKAHGMSDTDDLDAFMNRHPELKLLVP